MVVISFLTIFNIFGQGHDETVRVQPKKPANEPSRKTQNEAIVDAVDIPKQDENPDTPAQNITINVTINDDDDDDKPKRIKCAYCGTMIDIDTDDVCPGCNAPFDIVGKKK